MTYLISVYRLNMASTVATQGHICVPGWWLKKCNPKYYLAMKTKNLKSQNTAFSKLVLATQP